MSKALGFIIFVFIALVALNALFSMGSSLLSSSAHADFGGFGNLPAVISAPGNGNATPIHANLFAKDGTGVSYMTQGYGRTPYSYIYPNDWHDGIDIAASYGTPIYSPNDGTVIAVGNQDNYCYRKAFGKYVAVRDPTTNLVLWYAHLGTQVVTPGQTISKGTELGTVGATGEETGTHLHFSIFEAAGFTMTPRDGCGPEPTGQDINPLNYLGTVYN